MGCDIHAFVEYAAFTNHKGDPYWQCIMSDVGSRDYEWFGVLAGVRSEERPLFEPRGLPEGPLSHKVESYFWVDIRDEYADQDGYCSEATAAQWAEHGDVIKETVLEMGDDGTPKRVRRQISHPDLHTTGWLTCDELGQLIAHWITTARDYPYDVSWDAAYAAMRALEERGHTTRLIFGFDN